MSFQVISELKGKDINALIAEGQKKLASVPSGGAAPAAAPAAAAGIHILIVQEMGGKGIDLKYIYYLSNYIKSTSQKYIFSLSE